MYDLSILIPARKEMFLAQTVKNLLENIRGNTEIIVSLNGSWADPGIPQNNRVTTIYNHDPIGQRAATNQACRLSKAKYVMKIDAHCAVSEGFDKDMMEKMQDDWTMIPALYNLHGFNWKCNKCKNEWYQGPKPKHCQLPDTDGNRPEHENPNCENTTDFERVIIWEPRLTRRSEFYRFDLEPHFQYHRARKSHPEAQGEIAETMSAQGSCFMLTRKKYWELNICDEEFGSWGSQGIEVACKTWLSGGRLVTYKKPWYSHMFRTQHGFGFPYPIDGKQQEHAKVRARKLLLENKWPGQIRPFAWLIEKFKPMPNWHEPEGKEMLDQIMKAAVTFTGVNSVADLTSSPVSAWPTRKKQMASNTMGSSSLNGTVGISSQNIDLMGDKPKMNGVATKPIITNVVDNGNVSPKVSSERSNQPSVHDSMDSDLGAIKSNSSISKVVSISHPNPTTANTVERNFRENPKDSFRVELVDRKDTHKPHYTQIEAQKSTPSKGIIYYTDNQLNMKIARACRKQLLKAGLPIVSTSLKPMNFGKNIWMKSFVRGYEAYFKQILRALEESNNDIIYFGEHDWLYHPSHFDFIPPRKDTFYYNWNWWRIRSSDGLAVHYDTQLVPGIVAYKALLISYYKQVVEYLEKEGFSGANANKIGFEPGTHKRVPFVGNYKVERFDSKFPIIDIRHTNNLTSSKWTPDAFRSPKNARNWKKTDEIPGWGIVKNKFQELLASI